MIYKISTVNDVNVLIGRFPTSVIDECKRVAVILDENYNSVSMNGGFAAVIENADDLKYVKSKYVDYTDIPYEFADRIADSEFASVLFLPATEYSITLIIPLSVLPENITIG